MVKEGEILEILGRRGEVWRKGNKLRGNVEREGGIEGRQLESEGRWTRGGGPKWRSFSQGVRITRAITSVGFGKTFHFGDNGRPKGGNPVPLYTFTRSSRVSPPPVSF